MILLLDWPAIVATQESKLDFLTVVADRVLINGERWEAVYERIVAAEEAPA